MSKLVLIDGNAILHRAYHALPPLTTRNGEPINAVYGLVSMLLRVIQDLKPTHIAACFDRKEPTFRHLAFKDYQAQRPPMEKDLSIQFEKVKDVLTAMGIPIYEMAGYEADDLLGSIAEQAQSAKDKDQRVEEVVIVTGDRDQFQLVNDKVKLYMPITGLSNAKLVGTAEVIEKMGVKPNQIPDFKALVGDPSDNYLGVAGIGPKTAISLLSKFKSKEGIYKKIKEVPRSIHEKLERGKDNADLSLRLAKIVTDVPIEFNVDDARNWRVDDPQLLELFSKYGFKTLTKRVKEVGKSIVGENQEKLF